VAVPGAGVGCVARPPLSSMLCIRGALSGECECACGSTARCAGRCCAGASPPPGCGAPPSAASPFWPAGSAAAAAAAGATNGIVGPLLSEGCADTVAAHGAAEWANAESGRHLSQMLDELHGVKGSLLQSSSQPNDCTQVPENSNKSMPGLRAVRLQRRRARGVAAPAAAAAPAALAPARCGSSGAAARPLLTAAAPGRTPAAGSASPVRPPTPASPSEH